MRKKIHPSNVHVRHTERHIKRLAVRTATFDFRGQECGYGLLEVRYKHDRKTCMVYVIEAWGVEVALEGKYDPEITRDAASVASFVVQLWLSGELDDDEHDE
jgi:hypothetical protein